MCLCQIGEMYDPALSRVILGPLIPSHTSEPIFPRQHCTLELLGVRGFSQKYINKNVHNTLPIPDLPTKKARRWDILELDTFRFKAFKGLINSKSRISFYFVCESKQPFAITNRTHHPLRLRCQPTMNLNCIDSTKDLFEFHSQPRLNG
jgi:hypothetical protein